MFLVKGFNFGSAISTVFEKFKGLNSEGQNVPHRNLEMMNPPRINISDEGRRSTSKLRFHTTRGKAITLTNDFTVANRDESFFEHSVVFSHRPVDVNETVAVEVMSVSSDFHGPLRIGFTACNPLNFQTNVPLGRDLKSMQGFWIRSVQLFPIQVGTVVYFKVDADGTVLYGVDGQNGGVFFKDIDVSQRLWVMLEAYGSVQSLRFVDKTMALERTGCNLPGVYGSVSTLNSPIRTRRTIQATRRVLLQSPNTPLNTRRNVRLAPLQNIDPPETLPRPVPATPMTPAYASPLFSPGLCIICTDREKNAAFAKCGHLLMCLDCAEAFKNQGVPAGRGRAARKRNLCPVCRQPIASILRVYM